MSGRRGKRRFLLALCLVLTLLFGGLGIWQVERLAWKRALIERVDARVSAPPVAAPPRSSWPAITAEGDEYRRVAATGVFNYRGETLVDALTERGAGYWVLTPLRTTTGTILVNRGFVPREQTASFKRTVSRPQGEVIVNGLLRITEPEGRFLRPNDPAQDRWFSRDIAAIAKARGLGPVAPFFIDADAASDLAQVPVGGLTVVRFRNAHLVYALTWFALCALSLCGLVLVARSRETES